MNYAKINRNVTDILNKLGLHEILFLKREDETVIKKKYKFMDTITGMHQKVPREKNQRRAHDNIAQKSN